jgi:hypothetical protein
VPIVCQLQIRPLPVITFIRYTRLVIRKYYNEPMNHLRIILDKSVVFGLNNLEIDALDRYFFLIVPPILKDEILADLTKEAEDSKTTNRIAGQSYRISGNRGLTPSYRFLLGNSLEGREVPMEGKYLPLGESMVRLAGGSIGTRIETNLEDETIARWERKNFSEHEKVWAKRWRRQNEVSLNPKMYLDKINEAGLSFTPPKSDEELVKTVDSLLEERNLQARLFFLLFREHGGSVKAQDQVIKRWFKEGRPMFRDFAPYAFYCIRVNFLWALGLTNPQLFKADKNDRKDREYCYYLPHCEIFSSKDDKHKRLVPYLLKSNQRFIDGNELKKDLRKLSENWEALPREEKLHIQAERGNAPPEDESSLVFRLWKELRGEISKPLPLEILQMKLVDSSLPKEQQVEITLEELLRSKMKEFEGPDMLSVDEIGQLRQAFKDDPSIYTVRKTKIRKERIKKLYPQLTDADLDQSTSES